MTLWRLTAREIRRRPGRALLTLLSIAIGMAAIVAVSLGTATTRQAYQRMYEEVAGRAALEVTAEGGGTFPESLAETVRAVKGVRAAVPSVQRRTVLKLPQKQFDLLVMGIDPVRDSEVRDYELRDGRLFSDRNEVAALLEVGFAEGAGIRLGDSVKLISRRPLSVKVVGLVGPRGVAGFNKGGVIFLPLGAAQRWFTARGQVNSIDIVLQEGVEEAAVARQVRGCIPTGLDVRPAAARTQMAEGTTLYIEQGLHLASCFAVALAVIIILNTFLMNISERRRQLATLRAVGATRAQVIRMLLGEGLVMGALGTALGCLLGAGGGYLLMVGITHINVGTPPPVIIRPWAFLLAAVLGPATAVLSALVPALMATRISPVEAMQPAVSIDGARIPRWLTLTGILLAVVTGILLAACIRNLIPLVLCVLILVVFAGSFVLLMPWLVGPLGRGLAWLLRPVLRLEGRLAHRQVRRRPVRTALTAGVLYMAVCVGIGLGTTIMNTVGRVHSWSQRTMVGDFFLRATFPDTATGETVPVPMEVADEVGKVPGISNVDTMRFFSLSVADRRVFVVAMEFTGNELPLDLYRASPTDTRRRLLAGEVVVGTVLAQRAGIHPDDEITLKTPHGDRQFRVAALAVDYMVGGYVIYIRRSVAEPLFNLEGVNALLITAEPEARPAVHDALAKLAGAHGLMLHSFADLSREIDLIVAGVVGGLWGILVLGFVVAAFGIANTLTMNVLEQTRELAMLRVVAMTRGQVRKMVLSQAGLMGVIGLVLGTLAGTLTAYIISLSMMPLLGYPVDFVVQPLLLVGCFAVGLVLVLLAALVPAERAARLDLLIALQHE
jgi:putative ABC transport system permease protein